MTLNQSAYVILGLLSIEPNRSGYDMRKTIQGSVGYFWGESYGQIYPSLKRLLAGGLIAPGRAESNGRRERQTYVLTDAGHARLREWLAVPFHDDPPRNEFLLKLFFGREAAPGVPAAHLRDFLDRNRRMLAMLVEIEASSKKQHSSNPRMPYWMLTLTLGVAMTRAAIEWGEKALAEISALESPRAQRTKSKGSK